MDRIGSSDVGTVRQQRIRHVREGLQVLSQRLMLLEQHLADVEGGGGIARSLLAGMAVAGP